MIGSAYYLPCTLCLLTQLPLRLYDTLFILGLKCCSIYFCLPRMIIAVMLTFFYTFLYLYLKKIQKTYHVKLENTGNKKKI